ncbi:TetR/AcrR family transcriptional regulator [Sphingobacterium sp. SYP-B4668]|uniref:TetR/AcrR family transcriptional regulator n=1 Tax=Sphingobacterium sp. SYP-B4668 TaxID=2996035 RepID=UPI0022DD5091|nr:TetR/AcrR family transcriptional regulator [Sphingobacterium sp. SYP-B4668]
MDTKSEIIRIGDSLIRDRGYHAFSFTDISTALNIRNASIHYHFATKTSLGIQVVRKHFESMLQVQEQVSNMDPLQKLHSFLNIYVQAHTEDRVCIIGALAPASHAVEAELGNELSQFANSVLRWLSAILEEGQLSKVFFFNVPPRTKALMIVTNMLAGLQLARLTGSDDFYLIKQTVINDLTQS